MPGGAPRAVFHSSPEAMARALAGDIAAALDRAAAETGRALLIVPGGSSPRGLIRALGPFLQGRRADIVVTTSDERCVPLESEDSNAGQVARLAGIEPVWLAGPEFRLEELPLPAAVAVLGMGSDGHFASLFPGEPLDGDRADVVAARAPAAPRERLSLTMRIFLEAGRLILLAPGEEKAALCRAVLKGQAADLPLAKLIERADSRLGLHFDTDATEGWPGPWEKA